MTVTSGFFNSLSGDRKYDAVQFSQLFEGIIEDGVFGAVDGGLIASATTGMVVSVAKGRAWFNGTWTDNDSTLLLTHDAAEPIYSRIDTIVLKVDKSTGVRSNSIEIIKGVGSTEPSPPTLVNTTEVFYYPLADVLIGSGITDITALDITNRIGTADCPFVAGSSMTIDMADLLVQKTAEFDAWMINLTEVLDENAEANLLVMIQQNEMDISTLETDAYNMENMQEGATKKILSNGTQAIDGDKTYNGKSYIKQPREHVDDSISNGNIDSDNGSIQWFSPSGDVTIDGAFSVSEGESVLLCLIDNGHTITWSNITWIGDVPDLSETSKRYIQLVRLKSTHSSVRAFDMGGE